MIGARGGRGGAQALYSLETILSGDERHSDTRWSRRGLFSARGLAASAGGLVGALLPETKAPPEGGDAAFAVWRVARRAMNCEFSLLLPPTLSDPVAVGEAALNEIEAMEELLSVYRTTSAVSYVNAHAANGPVRVDDRLFRLLERSQELSRQTEGAFDAAAGALVRAWGFAGGPRRIPSGEEIRAARDRSGMRHVELHGEARTVRFRTPGVELNFGSIGKGYAIDRALATLRENFAVEWALIQGGSSSIFGLGSPNVDGRGWRVGIEHPSDPQRVLAEVRLCNRAMGTSGNAEQGFEERGRRYGHLLDPRTGQPATELASVSVLADDGATADALATALYVMGLDKATAFCKDHATIGAVLVLRPAAESSPDEPLRVVTLNLSKGDVEVRPEGGGAVWLPRRAGGREH